MNEQDIALAAFRLGIPVNVGIEAAYTDGQKENRAKLVAFAQFVAEECAKVADEKDYWPDKPVGRAIRQHFGVTPP
jgi:hypothetical protein